MDLTIWVVYDMLDDVATRMGCESVYQMFCVLGENWGKAEWEIKMDFKRYIKFGEIPFYVRDGMRKYGKD